MVSSSSSRFAAKTSNSEFPIGVASIPYRGLATQRGPLPFIGHLETAAPDPCNEHVAQWGELSSPGCVIHPGEKQAWHGIGALLVKSLRPESFLQALAHYSYISEPQVRVRCPAWYADSQSAIRSERRRVLGDAVVVYLAVDGGP